MPPVRLPFRISPPGFAPSDVAGFGLNSIDLVVVVAEYPQSNMKQRLQQFVRLPGGQTATALAACAKLGWKARYIGSFGDDELGQLSRASLVQAGVDITASRTVEGATNQFAIVLVDAQSGERTVLWDRHPGLATDPAALPREAVTSGRMLIVDCYETASAAQAARYAREAGIPTIVDVEHVRPGFGELLRNIDAIIRAEQFPFEFSGHQAPGRALEALEREFRAPLVCVTL